MLVSQNIFKQSLYLLNSNSNLMSKPIPTEIRVSGLMDKRSLGMAYPPSPMGPKRKRFE